MLNFTRITLGLMAIALAILSVYLHRLADDSKLWPSVEGKLDDSGVKVIGEGGFNQYSPYVRYSYRVGDKIFRGDRVRIWDMGWNSRKLALEYLNYRVIGGAVKVYYDPANPNRSILDQAYPVGVMAVLLVAAVLFGVFAMFVRQIVGVISAWLLRLW